MTETVAMMDNNVTRAMSVKDSNRLLLPQDIVFESENEKYEIYSNQLIDKGGESLIYKAKRMSNNEVVVAKIYDRYNPNDRVKNRNRKLVLEFLSKNSDYQQTHIMPLIDHGFIDVIIDDGNSRLPVDILPLCEKGTLNNKKIDYNSLKSNLIPSVFIALNQLHTSRLVHRDLKPNNLYMLNDVIVLSDFGTTSEIISDENSAVGLTQERRGTPGYRAPEVFSGFFEESADYYSFGCTIASLYKGEHVYQRILNTGNESELNASMRKGLQLDCPETEADLQSLVNALVMPDSAMRAGKDGVKSWLDDSKSFISAWSDKLKYGYGTSSFVFPFENTTYTDVTELTDAMLEKWDKAKRYLYGNQTITSFFKDKNPSLWLKAFNIVEGKGDEGEITAHNHNLGLAMFLHYLNTTDKPTCPIYWDGKKYENLSEISTAITTNAGVENSIIKMLEDKFLSWKFDKENYEQEKIDRIKDIEDLAAKYPKLGYYFFMYKSAPATDENNIGADELFKNLTEKSVDWFKDAEDLLTNDKTLAYILSLDFRLKNIIFETKERITGNMFSDNGTSDLTLLYQLFESICEDKAAVREHFLKYGPQAYLIWFLDNLNLYSFNSPRAKSLEQRIKSVKIDKTMDISDISSGCTSLRQYLKEFVPLFQNNYLLTYLGLDSNIDTAGITTAYSYAFFAGKFHGINVPVGYLKSISN